MIGIIIVLSSFFIGSIPFGKIVANFKGIDITKHGSGNIGATNVFRIIGKKYGLMVLFLDALKGFLPTYSAIFLTKDPTIVVICGFAAIMGHMFSPFLNFKGGKGVATGVGVFLAISPRIFILALILGLLIIALTQYVSLGSLTGSLFFVILMFRSGQPPQYSIMASIVAVFILIKHIPNIKRLLNGEENKLSWTK